MAMSKKDYELIARTIQDSRTDFKSNKTHAQFAGYMAYKLAEDNPRFDLARFMQACMPTVWVGSTKEAAWDRVAAKWAAYGE